MQTSIRTTSHTMIVVMHLPNGSSEMTWHDGFGCCVVTMQRMGGER
jgi:hypothetical protein